MPTCGKCHQTGQSIDHIRACYQTGTTTVAEVQVSHFAQQYIENRDYKPMALNGDVPDSRYALDTPAGPHFYKVKQGKGKWAHVKFVSRLIGHPGDFLETPVRGANKAAVLNLIAQDPQEAAVRFSREFTLCAVCLSPLTDPESRERGLGPVCAGRF